MPISGGDLDHQDVSRRTLLKGIGAVAGAAVLNAPEFASARQFVVLGDAANPLAECPQLKLLRMEGEVYFGAVHPPERRHCHGRLPIRSGRRQWRCCLVRAACDFAYAVVKLDQSTSAASGHKYPPISNR